MPISIDLNSDLGEQENDFLDKEIMPFISSCNIACGGHAGDENTVQRTIELAAKHQVVIGAHPSFPDKENFGREVIKMESEQLKDSLHHQITMVQKVAKQSGLNLHHVKPHGALYNVAAIDAGTSRVIYELVRDIDSSLKVYGLARSTSEDVANDLRISFVAEAFADRRYEDDYTLRSRKKEGAVLKENEVIEQVENLVFDQKVYATKWIHINAQTICLHSDTPGSVTLAKRIHEYLASKGAVITSV
ncbi:MAG: 5-oxoprolinase subunit PxpA [Bacteroidota bacterium]